MNYLEIENIINYKFNDKNLLKRALLHSSYSNEHRNDNIENNERLEFLGDAVLEIIVSEYLYKTCNKQEGDLSKMRAAIVCEKALASWCFDNNLGDYIILGNGEESTGGRKRSSLLSDCLEAIFGAVYLDGGLESARRIILNVISNILNKGEYFIDNKTKLQEFIQEFPNVKLSYVLVDAVGPDHDKTYTIEVKINNTVFGIGKGSSKKTAQQNAAKEAIDKLNNCKDNKNLWSFLNNDTKRS